MSSSSRVCTADIAVESARTLTVATLVAFPVLWALRIGLDDSAALAGAIAVMTLLPVWAGVAAIRAFPRFQAIALAVALAVGLCLPAAGLFLGPWLNVLNALILIGVLFSFLKGNWTGAIGNGVVLGILLIVSLAWPRILLPELLSLGFAHADNIHQVARAQMAASYGVPTLGADGLAWAPLHVATNLITAGMAKGVDAPVPVIYAYWAVSL